MIRSILPVPKAPERKLSVHQGHEVLLKLEMAGCTPEVAQRIIESKGNSVAEDMVYVASNGVYEPTKSQKAAKEIMGNNYFGIEDATEYFKIRPSRTQLAMLSEVPFSEETLRACKNTHVLAARFPRSILEMFANKLLRCLFGIDNPEKEPWFKKHGFSWNEGRVGWYLICINPTDDSFNKEWVDQLAQFGDKSDPAPASVAVYTAFGYFLKTGKKMFEKGMARCAELDMNGRRITVGPFKNDGLRIQAWWDDARYYETGAASVRKEK
ncbi:MAG: hypothetical protein ACYC3G_01050 [Minisyncoccota bacterium]